MRASPPYEVIDESEGALSSPRRYKGVLDFILPYPISTAIPLPNIDERKKNKGAMLSANWNVKYWVSYGCTSEYVVEPLSY